MGHRPACSPPLPCFSPICAAMGAVGTIGSAPGCRYAYDTHARVSTDRRSENEQLRGICKRRHAR
eukprot:11189138-Lingulodinium_polyedra.AAC.1